MVETESQAEGGISSQENVENPADNPEGIRSRRGRQTRRRKMNVSQCVRAGIRSADGRR